MNKKFQSTQDWLYIKDINNEGIIEMNDNSLIKILKIYPINYNLKNELEKSSILNSYKNLMKNYNSNLQVLILSKKEDISKQIEKIKSNSFYSDISNQYIDYITNLNSMKKSANKNFYIILKSSENISDYKVKITNLKEEEKILIDKFTRIGNYVSSINNEKDVIKIFLCILGNK